MRVIGLSGKMGSGKNHISEKILYPYFKNQYNIPIIGFGDQIKTELYARDIALSYDDLHDKKTFETRKKLQLYGTENGRDRYRADIWIRGLDMQIESFCRRCGSENALVIITDVRFKGEYDYVINKGGKVIRIISPQRTLERYNAESNDDEMKKTQIMTHTSETDLDDSLFEYVIYNDYKNTVNIQSIMENFPTLFEF